MNDQWPLRYPILVNGKKKVAVIGSGPVGATIAHELVISGKFEVNLFDQANLPSHTKNISDLRSNRLQLSSGEIGRNCVSRRKLVSSEIGGFSKVWGGTWDQLTFPEDSKWKDAYKSVDNLVNLTFEYREDVKRKDHYCECQLQEQLDDSKYSVGQFAISFSKSKLLLSRLAGNRRIDGLESWSSTQLLELISKYPNFVFSKGRRLISFQSHEDFVSLNFEGSEEIFDILVLAAGPIGTSEIICRSMPGITLRLQDTALAYSAAFRLPKMNQGNRSGFSHISSKLTDDNNSVLLYSQFYTHMFENQLLITKRIPFLLKPIIGALLYLLNPFLIVILHYTSTAISDGLDISCSNGTDCIIKRNGKALNYYRFFRLTRYLAKTLRKKGIFLLSFTFIKARVGQSFHSGAAIDPPWNESGKLTSQSNVYVAGALALKSIDPGPITKTSMAQAILVSQEIISKVKE